VKSLPILIFLLLTTCSHYAFAKATVVVCSQNLARVGKEPFGKKQDSVQLQRDYLVSRFIEAECDVIAVQEVYGRTKQDAEKNLAQLVRVLEQVGGDKFLFFVGEAEYDEIRNGFLVRSKVGRIKHQTSPFNPNLPKLFSAQRSLRPTRLPFSIQIDIAESAKDLLLINIHFKSKVGGFKDPTGTDFETVRMQSAEQARTFAEELDASRADVISVILGDRNSGPQSATDYLLEGSLQLEDFRRGCELRQNLSPDCSARRPPRFRALLNLKRDGGSTRYRGSEELIDNIYLESDYYSSLKALPVGLEGEFSRGSDHKLLWVELPL